MRHRVLLCEICGKRTTGLVSGIITFWGLFEPGVFAGLGSTPVEIRNFRIEMLAIKSFQFFLLLH